MFWKQKNEDNDKLYLVTSSCQRNSFRLENPENSWVRLIDQYIPINDLSIDGVSFNNDKLHKDEVVSFTIRLNNDILIDVIGKILHKEGSTCGCCFTEISYPDKEVLNIFILEETGKAN
ncbi:MAG: PilZ domain-containing protein [Gammaproteobacteria bacterium]|nr:PilZ domain-containing protein [Gammaproteobacteria bacterium]